MTSGPDPTDAAEVIAAAVRTAPGVTGLHAGGPRPVVTLLPGRRVDGVQLTDERVTVSVVVARGVPVPVLAEQVRTRVEPLAGGRPVDVHVADLQLPEDEPPALPPGPSA
ncbi:Uncharacterized conserved protein YloU, alkaline shock protein (Asp23) family [Geodermatophilus pulveris]|uniref:Uncharacterized conserved protein YloU, alkaline shock protein (Asp23) family n=1 Tax=Geodermatophilus pulveris TaxID=1564159 RepID=A0A239AHK6_9ACTN|nr:hypothetical protein [Geodermatophilus pulveris]SNR95146.1 Uncharacterized conserved protein YloU, alkaline shock protein (Asp23) family [Geodermatophilus pulveris]